MDSQQPGKAADGCRCIELLSINGSVAASFSDDQSHVALPVAPCSATDHLWLYLSQ